MDWVLDASALLAFLHGERGGDLVERELEHSVISAVNWSEVLYTSLSRGVNVDGLREDLEALGLSIEPFTVEDAERAAMLRPQARPLGLSLGGSSLPCARSTAGPSGTHRRPCLAEAGARDPYRGDPLTYGQPRKGLGEFTLSRSSSAIQSFAGGWARPAGRRSKSTT